MHHHGGNPERSGKDGRHGKGEKPGLPSWFSEMGGRKGIRIERGEIQYLLLDVLHEKKRHGYDIMQRIQEKTGGLYRPSPGSVYPVLQLLEDMDMIQSSVEEKRKVYGLTDKGEIEFEAKRGLLEDIYGDMDRSRDSEWEAFFEAAHGEVAPMFKTISRSFRRGEMDGEKAGRILAAIRRVAAQVTEILAGKNTTGE